MHSYTLDEKNVNPEIDMLVIGAGPVGLRFVIELLKKAKQSKGQHFKIEMIERNKSYTRTQDLTLNFALLENDPHLKSKLLALVKNEQASMDSHGNIHISIQALENCLATYANELGINMTYKRFMTSKQYEKLLLENKVSDRPALEEKLNIGMIVGREEITKCYPKCKIIVGADGAHSSVRQLMSGQEEDASVDKTDLRYLVEIKYLARGKVEKLSKFNYYRSQALLYGFLCSESIKYLKDSNQSQVTIRFLVDEKTYNDIRLNNINAKNLLPLCADLPLPSLLRKVINIWLDLRDDIVELKSATINKTILSIYSSKTFGTADHMQAFLLLGDAASGFPYMNGLNLGTTQALEAAGIIIEYISAIMSGDLNSMDALLKDYSAMTKAIFDKGFKIVAAKDHEITNNKRIAQSVYVSSVCIKMPEQSIREVDHPIFLGVPKPYCLKLNSLNNYVENNSGNVNNETYLLSMRVLELLIKHQRMVIQNPVHADFPFLKAVLSLACYKNQAIVTRAKNWGMLSSLSKHAVEPVSSKKSRCEIVPDEIEQAIENHVADVPEQSVIAEGSLSYDHLHHIIRQLFTSAIVLEKSRNLSTVNHHLYSNRLILMASEEKLVSPTDQHKEKVTSSCAMC